jgi:UDP-N-acetyl-D-galactosamine dehydrogenase
MGKFIAQRLVKLMIHAGMPLKGSRVGILGVTFKENVTDIRNSRVPDIARELEEFGIEALIHDPLADGKHVEHEYGMRLYDWDSLNGVNGLVYAVPHDTFRQMTGQRMANLLTKGGVFVDVKSSLKPSDVPSHVSYWSL